MANYGQRIDAHRRRGHDENGGESGRARGLEPAPPAPIDERVVDALRHIGDVAEAQHKRQRSFTSTYTSSIAAAGMLFQYLHLPEEAAIQSANIENNSTIATLTVFEGPGGGGRVIGIVKPSHSKRLAIADHISSLSIVADLPDPSPAIVIVNLSTHKWSPTQGSLL
jgi:hypothetical protein